MKNSKTLLLTLILILTPFYISAKDNKVKDQALTAMKAGTEFMMNKVSYNGGFAWNYLPDLSRQWGEMESKRSIVWTQSPSTPAVGQILLDAYHATGDEYYYDAACKVASALIWGQHESGGWNYLFDFAGEESLKEWYRTIGHSGWRLEEYQHYYGNATYDDSCTTDCAKFLLRIYVEKYDPKFLPALEKAIDFVLESQYPVGGWPQRYPLMNNHPFQGKEDYSSFITLNDDVIPQATDFLLQCYQSLGVPGLKEPILRAMRLIILLQQGQPYPGWSDQYTVADLKPAHARSYEPRGISSSTTVRCIRLLMSYYRLTGDTRFLSGIPAALDYLESQKLPAEEVEKWGRKSSDPDAFLVPRFIQPETGLPQYVHREGSNVFNGRYFHNQDISNTIGHYGSAAWVNTKALRAQYEELLKIPAEELTKNSPLASNELVPLQEYYTVRRAITVDDKAVKDIIKAQNSEGCWLSPMRNTSNPYKPCPDATPSKSTDYASTNVGDQYDTSPYRYTGGDQMVISTSDYINKMSSLINYVINN